MLVTKKYTKNLKVAVCLFIAIAAIFLLGNFVLAATSADLGLNYAAGTGLNNTQDIRITIAKIIRIALGFLGIIAISLIIYAGWLWMTSGGNPEKIEQAKKILQNAVIGLIIILSAFAIVSFILNMLGNGSGGNRNGPGGGPGANYGLSALGNGIIESHYPARDQREVPRNTSIIITFREPMLASTLCTITDTALNARCAGEDMNKGVIGIFKKSDEKNCIVGNLPLLNCASLADARVYSSADNKIFVFVPKNYLGSPSEYIDYTVFLGKELKRQLGCQVGDLSKCNKAFPGFEMDYGWSFQVSTKIDLTPPQVQKNGVFPSPDDFQDTTNSLSGAKQAKGTITVYSRPLIYSGASVSFVSKPAGETYGGASVTVDESCNQGGELTVNVDGSNKSIVKLTGSGDKLLGQGSVVGKTVSFPQVCNLQLTLAGGDFAVGNLWTMTVAAMTPADTVTVGNITYTASSTEDKAKFSFKVSSTDNNITVQSIKNVLANNSEVEVDTVNSAGSLVAVKAKVAGLAGNSLNLSSSNSAALKIIPMAGGADQKDKVTVNGLTDQPMNAAIQINFNEAIMPLTVAGTSSEVYDFIRVVNANANPVVEGGVCAADADCKSFKCQKNGLACEQNETGCSCAGANNYLEGKFAVSNQYSTVEFLSDKECGFNNCGEKIYCLPANSHLKFELNAADLISCENKNDPSKPDDSLCADKSPYNTCDITRKFCRKNPGDYYPQAAKTYPNIVNGITDAAFNSLDGNRNDLAYGKGSYYNENAPATSEGDSYKWSFFISDKLDLIPPKIDTTIPETASTSVDLINAVKISFDKLMLSSRLTTGSLMVQNGERQIQHYLLNLRSSVDQPLGYWVTNIGLLNNLGELDSTDAYLNHTSFSTATTYTAQAGSGLKDIYQNCFLPCAGPACSGDNNQVSPQSPCCCNGTAATSCP